jgi:hypothetical protein
MDGSQQKRKIIIKYCDKIISLNWIATPEKRALYYPYTTISNPLLAGVAFFIPTEP